MSNELTFAQLKPLLYADFKAGLTPALLGEPGIGKSTLIEDLAREFKTKVFTLPVNQLADRADLTGIRMTKSKDGDYRQSFFPHETIMSAIRYAEDHPDEEPILFLDEFNRASSDITSSILSFQTLRRIGTIDFPDNLRLAVAGNDKGNVISLDKASITRFSVYRVIPDVDTFLNVQSLNPIIDEVMRKNPEVLLAPQLQDVIETDEDEDDDEDDFFDLSSEFLDDDGFEQATVPRTITYTSEWLYALGIDKSGSDDELQMLQSLFTSQNTSSESNALRAGLIAHAGHTEFTNKVYDELHEYFNSLITGTNESKKAILDKFRPDQDIINQLSRSTSTVDVSDLIETLPESELEELLVWLFEINSVKEINNNQAIKTAIQEISHTIDKLESENVRGLNAILANDSNIYEEGIREFITSGSTLGDMYKDFISATLGF